MASEPGSGAGALLRPGAHHPRGHHPATLGARPARRGRERA